jgi:hypothetical protein
VIPTPRSYRISSADVGQCVCIIQWNHLKLKRIAEFKESKYRTACDVTENGEPQKQHEVLICEERMEWVNKNVKNDEIVEEKFFVYRRKKREGKTEERGGGKSEHLQEATPPIFANVEVKHLKSKQIVRRREWIKGK